jgi:hypothetical protein
MRRPTAILCLTLAVLLGRAGEVWSADFRKGFGAEQRGDFATALREWKPLAKQGNAGAQFGLSVKYAFVNGVPQDNVYACMWGSLGASNGSDNRGKLRNFVATKMTAADISTAQKLARECVAKKYKGC